VIDLLLMLLLGAGDDDCSFSVSDMSKCQDRRLLLVDHLSTRGNMSIR
jgi:hypothetical protein